MVSFRLLPLLFALLWATPAQPTALTLTGAGSGGLGFVNLLCEQAGSCPDQACNFTTDTCWDTVNGSRAAALALTVSRNSPDTCADTSNSYIQVAANIPCITNTGMGVWEARTNAVRNNTMQGAATGTPGTLPTNWTGATGTTGLSREIVATGTANGINYIDFKYTVTGGAGGIADGLISVENVTGIDASNGQTWTASVFVQLVGGTNNNISWTWRWSENDSSGNSITGATAAAFTPTAILTRITDSRTLVGGTAVGKVQALLRAVTTAGDVDTTIRVGWPANENNVISSSVSAATANGVVSAAVTTGGSGCTNGTQTFTGTTGTGTKAVYFGTVSGGALTALTVVTVGTYSVDPGVDTLSGGGCGVAPTATPVMGGGTGYGATATGTLTWSGTGCTTNPVINVTTNAGGAVVTVNSVTTAGSCTTFPSQTATTWTAGGGLSAGSGAALGLTPVNNAASGFATAPILTSGSAVSRVAMAPTLKNTLTYTSPFSMFVSAIPMGDTTFANQFALEVDNGTSNDRATIFRSNAQAGRLSIVSGGAGPSVGGTAWPINTSGRNAARTADTDNAYSFNGGAVVTSANVFPTGTLNGTRIGTNVNGTANFNGIIKSEAFWLNRGLSNTVLPNINIP